MGDAKIAGLWSGRTAACIASGPSLTMEDCAAIRAAGLPTVVVNTSYQAAPWADVLYAMDLVWWQNYGEDVARNFAGRKFCHLRPSARHGAICIGHEPWMNQWGNSGANGVHIAVHAGAARVLLVGYDCQYTNGQKHWHPDHPKGMGNAGSVKRWPGKFDQLSAWCRRKGAQVINCSRSTALECFERGDLAQLLHS